MPTPLNIKETTLPHAGYLLSILQTILYVSSNSLFIIDAPKHYLGATGLDPSLQTRPRRPNKTRIVEIFVLSPKNVTIEFYRIAEHSAKPRRTKSMGGAIV